MPRQRILKEMVREEQRVSTFRTGQWSDVGAHAAAEERLGEILRSAIAGRTQHDPAREIDLPHQCPRGQAALYEAGRIDPRRIFAEHDAVLVAVAADDDEVGRKL